MNKDIISPEEIYTTSLRRENRKMKWAAIIFTVLWVAALVGFLAMQ